MNSITLLITLNIISIIIGVSAIFLSSYFKEKGKQQAIKEHSNEITKIVEQVKMSFTQENEKLKAELQFLLNSKIGINSEKRAFCIDYFSKLAAWRTAIQTTGPAGINDRKGRHDKLESLEQFSFEFRASSNKLSLFIDDPEFHYIEKELIPQLINLEALVSVD